jgi:hypothetical protein
MVAINTKFMCEAQREFLATNRTPARLARGEPLGLDQGADRPGRPGNLHEKVNGGASLPSPSYDDDGNAVVCPLSSGTWSFTWDAENRMVLATKGTKGTEVLFNDMLGSSLGSVENGKFSPIERSSFGELMPNA